MECSIWEEDEFDYRTRFDTLENEAVDEICETDEVVANSLGDKMKKGKEKSVSSDKAVAALKNHSEAERRRRERINGHLATLQDLTCLDRKMDKATLLAKVINQVKDLQEHAIQVSKGLLIPMDADELVVEPFFIDPHNGFMTIKASLCCNFRPDLFTELKEAITSLKLKKCHSEISTLGERVKTLFILSSRNDINNINNAEAHINLANAVRQSLSSVLYKPPPLPEYSLRTTLLHKRFKSSLEDYSPRSVLSHKRFKSAFESSSSSS